MSQLNPFQMLRLDHLANPDLTWTGRGRKPQWVVEWLLGFGTLEQLALPERDTKTIDMYENA